MANQSRQERLQAKLEKQKRLEAEIRELSGRLKAESEKQRRRESFIVGAAILAELAEKPELLRQLQPVLDRRTVKPSDRRDIAHMLPSSPSGPAPSPAPAAPETAPARPETVITE